MITELILVYFLINLILQRRENNRWAPVRKIVAEQMASTYTTALHSANVIARIVFKPMDYSSLEVSKIYLQKFSNNLSRLQNLTDQNAIALGSNFMPGAVLFLENSGLLLKKLAFLSEIHNPARSKMDIIGLSPLPEIAGIENASLIFRERYQSTFNESANPAVSNPSPKEIEATWEEATRASKRLYLKPQDYQFKPGVTPYVYDMTTLQQLKGPPASGAKVQVCHHI